MFPGAFHFLIARKHPEKKVQRDWKYGEESEAFTSEAKYKETPNNSESKINNVVRQYFQKSNKSSSSCGSNCVLVIKFSWN